MDGPACTGCNNIIEEGSVIAFGESLFHLKCFMCAKCSEPVDCESNLLLLTNGRPVCESCSYCCNACKQVIRDEAIMTGDEAYHADCFQCVSCKKKIDDLVFTQTSKGIHCTPCHEKRRAEKQKRREERGKRQQQKLALNSKELPSIPSPVATSSTPSQINTSRQPRTGLQPSANTANRHTSRLFDPQLVSDYIQTQPRSRNPLDTRTRRPSTDPPTPTRSRSNSVEIPPKLRLADNRLTPSRSEVVSSSKTNTTTSPTSSSPSSPPLSIGSNSPQTSLHKNVINTSSSFSSSLTKSTSTTTLDISLLPEIPSLNLSFFDNDSNDLVNLTKTLGASISKDIYGSSEDKDKSVAVPVIVKTTENITRASQYLESSLMNEDAQDGSSSPSSPVCASLEEDNINEKLRNELDNANAKLSTIQTSYHKIKDASRKALDEFTRAKEEFAKEVALRQQQEYTIVQLKHQLSIAYQSKQMTRPELSVITKEEVERVARIRVELDKTCNELKGYRNMLVQDIDSLVQQKQAGLESNPTLHLEEQQKALVVEIKSLVTDRDQVRVETKSLEDIRDEVLHEMVMLNTKNAELTEMNNDLSRRVTEREREAAAVMAGTSFLYSPSPSLSSELYSPTNMQRKSSEASIVRSTARTALLQHQQQHQQQPPKIFKLKKKGNMFAKLSGKSNKVDSATSTIYGSVNANSTMSLSMANNESFIDYRQKNNISANSSSSNKQSQENTQHGSHTFLTTSFIRPVKCEACGEKIWGRTELRCQVCMYATHTRCLSHVPQLCYAGATTSSFENISSELELNNNHRSLFGNDLADQAHYEDRTVPSIIAHCISAVEKRGMDYEGIYRKSGGAAQMRLVRQAFDAEDPLDLEEEEPINDICAITSVLKQYLRELPNPVLPFNLYSQFIEAVSVNVGQEKTDKFFELLSQLPKVNYDTLRLLIRHLSSVQQRHSENLMTTRNLAMVFGPTLMRDVEATRDLIDMSYKNAVIEFLIVESHDLLP
ncbi:hypothetical protein BDF21DRAFT_386678 [Thamnidium elegans]|uniref:RhoGAP-domain-containing protein n=1 Tax=Thamnidium elegans TaxID=101142 RepID=A0A8H7SYT6_9FUNG|nr:hypothetical protein INT48_005572 [Thamnidium elegans]KAI8071956.1 hypothetical protein BDF21DRAFT_386678 [Thamnidium elegans]